MIPVSRSQGQVAAISVAATMLALMAGTAPVNAQSPIAALPVQSASDCEISVWPTRNGGANVQGIVSVLIPFGLLVDVPGHKNTNRIVGEMIVAKIPPAAQAAVMQRSDVIAALRLPPTTRVTIEETLPSFDEMNKDPFAKQNITRMGAALNAGTRLSASQSACYAELMVSEVGYARVPLAAPVLSVRWIYRRWRDGKPTVTVGWHRHTLSADIVSASDIHAASDKMLQDVYATDLIEWARKKLKS